MDESKKPEIKKVASKKPIPLSEKKSPVVSEKEDLFFDEISSQLDMLLSDDANDITPKANETKKPPAKTDDPMKSVEKTRKPAPATEAKDASRPAVKKADHPTEPTKKPLKPAPAAEEIKPAKDTEPEARTIQKEKDESRPTVKKPEDTLKDVPKDQKKIIQKEIPAEKSDSKFKRVKIVRESSKNNLQPPPPGQAYP
jgi:hypothetical protein